VVSLLVQKPLALRRVWRAYWARALVKVLSLPANRPVPQCKKTNRKV
jgi:hypothetical protein